MAPFIARELDSKSFEGPFQLCQFCGSVMTQQLVTGFGGIIMFMFTEESAAGEKKKKPSPRLNVHSAFWILASIAVTYYFDFFKSIKETIQADSWWFASGSCLLAACLSVAFYCIIYLEWYRGIEDYDVQYPVLIPITTVTFIAAAVCFNVALWPVWSFITPVVLFIQFMGVVMLVSLLG
uniref:Transmembrane protein 128 n=1 Tax=Chrysolophus pictus TaxID=9089 RepID=A0A8C3KXE9_CHRPC